MRDRADRSQPLRRRERRSPASGVRLRTKTKLHWRAAANERGEHELGQHVRLESADHEEFFCDAAWMAADLDECAACLWAETGRRARSVGRKLCTFNGPATGS
jgi:hypothetical protein